MARYYFEDEPAAPTRYYLEEPLSVRAGQQIREIPRQIGLAGRYAVEGQAQLADLIAEPIRNLLINPLVSAFGGTPIKSQTEAFSGWMDQAGVPSPQTPNERVIGDASRLVAGAGGAMGVAKWLSTLGAGATQQGGSRGLLEVLQANPAAQGASAAGAGLAGGATREAGGGPLEQFAASMVGGIAAPLAVGGLTSASRSASNRIGQIFKPKDIEGVLKVELERIGIQWDALSKQARDALMKDANRAIYAGQELNPAAIRRLADFRNIGATPMMGDVTMDPRTLTNQRNLAKQMANSRTAFGADLPAIENQNAQRVLSTLDDVADSPLDAYATGQKIIGKVNADDAAMRGTENALYRQARDSQGRTIPLDRQGFVDEAFANLSNSQRGGWLPDQVKTLLNDISTGKAPFDVDTIDMLKTLLAQESRATANGNVKMALSNVRDALENVRPSPTHTPTGVRVPVTGDVASRLRAADAATPGITQETLGKFNAARDFARNRRTWQESAKFIEDALDGAAPDKFVQKHIISGSVDELEKLAQTIGQGDLRDAVRRQLIEYIKTRGRADSDLTKFSSAGMFDALKALGDRKLALFFTPAEIQQIKSAVNVGRYMQAQPIGSAVNNSNTAAMVLGRLSDVLTRGSGIPFLGPMVADPLKSLTLSMQGRQMSNVAPGLLAPQPAQPFPVAPLLLAAGVPSRDQ